MGISVNTTQSRRAVLTGIASAGVAAGVLATSAPAEAFQQFPDPIFGAIERHRAAAAAYESIATKQSDLEEELPKAKRRTYLWDEDVVETGDPRWIKCNRDLRRAIEVEWDAAAVLVSVRPTTLVGIATLLGYAAEVEKTGAGWPDLEDGDGGLRNWYHLLIESLAEVSLLAA